MFFWLLLFILIAALLSVLCYWYLFRSSVNSKGFSNWHSVPLFPLEQKPELKDKLVQLFLADKIICLENRDALICFKSKPNAFSWGNTYVIAPDPVAHGWNLFLRGSLSERQRDNTNLRTILFYLKS
jgi:hypothetical protein